MNNILACRKNFFSFPGVSDSRISSNVGWSNHSFSRKIKISNNNVFKFDHDKSRSLKISFYLSWTFSSKLMEYGESLLNMNECLNFLVEWKFGNQTGRLVFNVIFSVISIYKSNWQQRAKIPTSIAIFSLSLSLCHAQSLTLFPKCGLKMCTLSFWCLLCSTIYSLSKNVQSWPIYAGTKDSIITKNLIA